MQRISFFILIMIVFFIFLNSLKLCWSALDEAAWWPARTPKINRRYNNKVLATSTHSRLMRKRVDHQSCRRTPWWRCTRPSSLTRRSRRSPPRLHWFSWIYQCHQRPLASLTSTVSDQIRFILALSDIK